MALLQELILYDLIQRIGKLVKMAKKIILGILTMVILSASIYFIMPDSVRIDIEKTRTKFSVWEDEIWVLSATEYVYLWDGSKKMRAKSRDLTYDNDEDISIVTRTSKWKDNITTIDTYTFDGNIESVELVPIEHSVECINCVGKIVSFEYRDILYEGITEKISSPFSFGHNMKLEWQEGAYYAKVFQQKSTDKIIVKYRPKSNYEKYLVRIFDPIKKDKKDIYNIQKCFTKFWNTSKRIYVDCVKNYTTIESYNCLDEKDNTTCQFKDVIKYYNSSCLDRIEVTQHSKIVCEDTGQVNVSGRIIEYKDSFCLYHKSLSEIHCSLCKDSHGGGTGADCKDGRGMCSSGQVDCQIIKINEDKSTEIIKESRHKLEAI